MRLRIAFCPLMLGAISLCLASSYQTGNRPQENLCDNVAVALLKLYSEEELKKPENIKQFLPLIRDSFPPSLEDQWCNREPKVTIFLLHWLEREVTDREIKREIAETIKTLEQGASL